MEQVSSILSVAFISFAMRAFWLDPYLWIHLAGLAALPLFLELCLVGLAIGDPILPVWLELLLVAGAGIAPVLWMQWQRPFYIFSIVAVALKPEQLTEDQRRLLTLFKSQRNRWVAVGVAIGLLFVLRWIYVGAAIASATVSALPGGRATGLLLAAAGFLGSNLFLQVPVSVAGVMLTNDSDFAKLPPYPLEQVRQSFTLLGLQLRQILPPLVVEAPSPIMVTDSTSETSDLWADSVPAVNPTPEPIVAVPVNSVPEPELESVPELESEPKTDAIVADLETELEQLETETTQTELTSEGAESNSIESADPGSATDPA